MKKRKRLTDEQAEFLGFKVKKRGVDGRNPRYFVTDEQNSKLNEKKEPIKEVKPKNNNVAFVLSAWSNKGKMMNIEEYCETYSLPKQDIKSYKLVSHTGTPYYNIQFKESSIDEEDIDYSKLKKVLSKEIKRKYEYKNTYHSQETETALKWADLHFGAHIRNILLVEDYDKDILLDGLMQSIDMNNSFGFKKTHVHIHGDLIESFSGLNHVNSWQSMDKEAISGNVIKMCSEMLHKALSKINNLGSIKIVAGNHDRTSKNNDEDVKGGAAFLIAYCLELMGYDVEFHPYVITHHVDGVNHIILHGDKGISKKSTEKIILDYGVQGEYNLICEAHLHSLIEKLSIRQRENFEIVKDDSLLHRRFTLPPFFPGNYYSATLGFTTNSGYFSIWSNNKNKPQFFNGSV